MVNPALEATQRAMGKKFWGNAWDAAMALDVAREALSPLRRLHQRNGTRDRTAQRYCVGCLRDWPCDSALLIYTSEELVVAR